MRAVVMTKHGPPEVLQVQERPEPQPPQPDEITVSVAAVGIGFSELQARLGVYPPAPKPPAVLGYDIAGTVAAVGANVGDLAVGDRVFGVSRFGGYAERVNTAADNVRPLPERLSFEQGAAIGVNYATAWLALVSYGGLAHRSDASVLIHGAAGGAGIAATQIAKRYGAEVWGTASASKHEAISKFGVDHPIDYRSKGWERGLPTFDVILDPLGGASWRTSYSMLRTGGRSINYGASTIVPNGKRSLAAYLAAGIKTPRLNMIKQMLASKSVVGLFMPALWEDRGTYGTFLQPLIELIDDGTITPPIDGTYPFANAPDAHRRLAERKNIGKVVLIPTTRQATSSPKHTDHTTDR
jgi:NADPH:quinone reductase-like Zn-dependent oxidoreductase